MKTKAEIVQRLLEEKKVDAEEAVILLMSDKQKEYVYIPNPYPVYPIYPSYPAGPVWIPSQWETISNSPDVTFTTSSN